MEIRTRSRECDSSALYPRARARAPSPTSAGNIETK